MNFTSAICLTVLLCATALVLSGCSSHYQWGWHILNPFLDSGWQNVRFLMWGYGYTIGLTVVSMFFSLLIGVILVIADMSKIALALADAAFEAEVLRSGIQSIDQGQLNAADALGLRFMQKFYLIILPQALRVVLPTLVNQSVYMLKMSSLASFIGLADLTRKATELVVTAYRPLEIYSFLVLEYLALILLMTWLI